MLKYEWDTAKAIATVAKHGVSFEEASSVFGDALAITFSDPDHSERENRLLTFGVSLEDRLLAVVHTARGRAIRIVSARKAIRRERGIHAQG